MSYADAGSLRLPQTAHDRIVAHALADFPRECCGLIVGLRGELHLTGPRIELFALRNAAAGLDVYEVDAADLFRVTRLLDEDGRDIVAIYHSHPTGPARPSATDIELAFWPDAWHLICSLHEPEAPSLRAFRIVDGAVTEARIELTSR